MPLVVRKFPGLTQLNEYLSGTIVGGPLRGAVSPGLFLHGRTLIFTQPVSATVTFVATPASTQAPMTLSQIKTQIEAQAAGVRALFVNGSLQLKAINGGTIVITELGTANGLLGLGAATPTSAVPIHDRGAGVPELVGFSSTDGISYTLTTLESSSGASGASQRFHLGAKSGVIAAALAANSALFAFRQPLSTIRVDIERLIFKWETLAGFTAEQEISFEILPVTSFAGTNYAGGTDLSHPSTLANKAYISLTGGVSALATGNIMIATTTALTHAGPSLATHPWMSGSFSELASAVTVHNGFVELIHSVGENVPPWPLFTDEGFIARNTILHGAGGTGRVHVEMVWTETVR